MDGTLVHPNSLTIQKTAHIVSSTPPILKARVNSTLTELDVSPASPPPILDILSSNWEVGFSCDVIIKVAEDVDCIYVQAVREQARSLSDKIQKELQEYSRYSLKPSIIPATGTYVAIFSEDGDLYRAQITDVYGEAIYILLINSGKSSTVSLGEIEYYPITFMVILPASIEFLQLV